MRLALLATAVALLGFAVLAGSAGSAGSAAAAVTSSVAPVSAVPYSWQNAKIVGGGFVDGLVFSDAERGLAYARTDVGGAYRWDAAAKSWIPLLDSTGFSDWNELGVQSIAADPRNAGKVWLATGEYTQSWASPPDGEILRSANQGRTWQVSDLPIQLAANQDGRDMGERLAVDPADDQVLYLASPANGLWRSTDGGAKAALDISASPYLAWGGTPKFGWWIASIAIDPFNPDHAIYGTGATVFGTDDLTAADRGQATAWSSAAAEGIEETAIQDLIAPAAGPCKLVSAVGDLGGFCHTALTASPAGGMIAPILSTGTSIAEAGAAPLDIAMVGWDGGDFSADGGATWSAMTLPPGVTYGAGAVALSADGSALVWTPENQSYAPEPDTPFYSTDHGQTWTAVSGLPAGVLAVADPVNPAVFYAFDPSTGTLYASADGGAAFTNETTGLPTGTGAEQTSSLPQLHTVPGCGADLWLTGGDDLLYHSADGGKTFSPVTSVATVATLGFGQAAPGARYPAIYLVGIVGGVQGVFRSTDDGASWARINTDAQQWGWIGQSITGDPNIFGRVYLATNGRGIQYANPAGGR